MLDPKRREELRERTIRPERLDELEAGACCGEFRELVRGYRAAQRVHEWALESKEDSDYLEEQVMGECALAEFTQAGWPGARISRHPIPRVPSRPHGDLTL